MNDCGRFSWHRVVSAGKRSVLLAGLVAISATTGCKTPSMLSDSQRQPAGGVAQVDEKRWTDILRPRRRLEKVDVPVWEVPNKETDVAAIQLAYGRWMETSGDLKSAAAAYEKVLAEKPASLEATIGLARIHAVEGRTSEARKAFDKALNLSPNSAEVLSAYGKFELDQNNVDAAAQKLVRAVEVAPNDTATRYALGVVRARQGQWGEARALFVATVGEAEAHYNLGMLMKDSRPGEAAAEFRAAIEKKPSLAQAATQLAQLEQTIGNGQILRTSHTAEQGRSSWR